MCVRPQCFHILTHMLMSLAEGRLVLALEVKLEVHLRFPLIREDKRARHDFSVCVCACVFREVIIYSRQQKALQPVSELCWEEPVLPWPRPQPHPTGKPVSQVLFQSGLDAVGLWSWPS